MKRTLIFASIALLALGGTTAPVLSQDTGSADFTRYVSIGDSLTAGFSSGGLVEDVQRLSYPALIHRQATGNAGGFEQPLISAPGIPPVLQLRSLSPLVIAPPAGLGSPENLFLQRPYDNIAVPGADVRDVLETVSDGGGLHDVILRGLGTQLEQTIGLQPTFVSVWIGSNDALGAALAGIVVDDVTLTSTPLFEARYRAMVGALQAFTTADLALATIASVTSVPFVTTIPPILVDPETSQPVVINGQFVPLIGPDGPLTLGVDLLTLNATQELRLGRGIPASLGGSGVPLSDHVVLSGAEIATIESRIGQFNTVIRTVAGEAGAALVDVNAAFGEIVAHGLHYGGIDLSTEFLTGGLFSRDGFHASPLGYAVLANEFLTSINGTFGASIPLVDLGPFIFGPDGAAGTGGAFAQTAPILFTRASENQMRFVFDIPNRGELARIKASLGAQSGDTGDDGEGAEDGDASPAPPQAPPTPPSPPSAPVASDPDPDVPDAPSEGPAEEPGFGGMEL